MSPAASASFRALGTHASVLVTEADRLPQAKALLTQELDAIDAACSRFREDSELARINRARGQWVEVSELLLQAVQVALRAAELTGGAVDPTVGRAMRAIGYDRDFDEIAFHSRELEVLRATCTVGWRAVEVDPANARVRVPSGVELDLGATAKALAADRAAQRIASEIGCGVLVNLGGDLAIAGDPPDEGWTVRVTDDHAADPAAPGQSICLRDGGLATSSTTVRRWDGPSGPVHHIVDPQTGEPAEEIWQTVSVAAASCVDANVASTAAIVGGEAALSWLRKQRLPSRLIRRSGEVVVLAGWPDEEHSWAS